MEVKVKTDDGEEVEGEVVDAVGPTVGVETEDGDVMYVSDTPASDDSEIIAVNGDDTSDDRITGEMAANAMDLGPQDSAGAEVDLGDTSPEAIEDEFGIDLDDTHTVSKNGYHMGSRLDDDVATFEAMDDSQRKKLHDALREKHGDEAVTTVLSTLQNRKSSSSPTEINQRGELMIKKAIGSPGEVRNNGKFAVDGNAVSQAEVEATRDLVRASQAFAQKHYTNSNGQLEVHRGLRREPSWDMFHRTVERPSEGTHQYKSGVTESHATVEAIANRFDDNVKASYTAEPDDVAYAIDAVSSTTMYESEVQMQTKDVTVSAEDTEVNLSGFSYLVDDTVSLADVSEGITNPESKDSDFHRGLEKTLGEMHDNGRSVSASEGVDSLRNWAETVDNKGLVNDVKAMTIKETVEKVTGTEFDN